MGAPKTRAPESAEDSSRGSSGTSPPTTTSASPYVAGPGPGFDPNAPLGEPPPAGEEAQELSAFELGWTPEQVESWLLNAGDLAHAAVGVGEHDWAMTKADLERIGPPLTRILNRFEPSRAVAAYSDPAAVAMGFGMYGWRSALERATVMKSRERAQELGVTPPAAEPGPGPAEAGETPFVSAADQLRATRPPEAP